MIVKLTGHEDEVRAALQALGADMRILRFPFGTFLAALGLERPPLEQVQGLPGVAWARAAGSRVSISAPSISLARLRTR